jgi:hypothetical protein
MLRKYYDATRTYLVSNECKDLKKGQVSISQTITDTGEDMGRIVMPIESFPAYINRMKSIIKPEEIMKNNKKITAEKKSTLASTYTIFYDMSSGGSEKESFTKLAVRLPETEAVDWFEEKYGHSPYNVTCSCCGEDYAVYEKSDTDGADLVVENPSRCNAKGDLLASLVAHVRDDCVILQERQCIEDGWFIKVIPSQVQLWEIPQFGGEEHLVATFPSITEAYRRAISLG